MKSYDVICIGFAGTGQLNTTSDRRPRPLIQLRECTITIFFCDFRIQCPIWVSETTAVLCICGPNDFTLIPVRFRVRLEFSSRASNQVHFCSEFVGF